MRHEERLGLTLLTETWRVELNEELEVWFDELRIELNEMQKVEVPVCFSFFLFRFSFLRNEG